jgi:O-antigen ligase
MGLLLGIFLLLKFFPKTINRFKELTYTKFDFKSEGKESHFNVALTADQWNGANVRMAVWQCAWAVTKNNLLFGTGIGDKMDVLRKEYAKNQFTVGVKTNRNVHNNYLDVWMSLGLVGFIIFLIGFFILPVFRCLQTNDWYGIAIIAAFMLALFSESYMDRTMGNTLLGFFLAFISSYKKPSQ